MNKQKKNKLTQADNRLVVTRAGEERVKWVKGAQLNGNRWKLDFCW